MIAYLLDKIASFRLPRLPGNSRLPKAADSPPNLSTSAPTTAAHDFKGIPSDAFFFGYSAEQYQAYLQKAHPDGSGCGAGCGSNSCGSAYPGGNT